MLELNAFQVQHKQQTSFFLILVFLDLLAIVRVYVCEKKVMALPSVFCVAVIALLACVDLILSVM